MRLLAGSALVVVVAVLVGPLAVASPQGEDGKAAVEPSPMPRAPKGYQSRQIEGWQVWVNGGLLRTQSELASRTLKLLGFQLYQVARVVPPEALSKLRTVRIWVEENEPNTPCMAYHPDPGWLREHGVNPEKARCVELANAGTFLEWTIQQPWMLLHELSHAYHHQFLDRGFDNRDIKAAYSRAMESKLYDRVLRNNGREEKAYATTNPMEYFAEASEACFGTNDFFPFVQVELKRHDPRGFEMLEKVWGVKAPGRSKPPKGQTTPRPGPSAKGRE